MEKTVSNVFENVTEAHKQAVDALMDFNKIAVRTHGLLAGQQLAALENFSCPRYMAPSAKCAR